MKTDQTIIKEKTFPSLVKNVFPYKCVYSVAQTFWEDSYKSYKTRAYFLFSCSKPVRAQILSKRKGDARQQFNELFWTSETHRVPSW